MTYATKHLDWLSLTFPKNTLVQNVFALCDWHYAGGGMHGYKFKYEDSITRMVWYEGAERDDMGCHLTITGEALSMLRSHFGGTDAGVVSNLVSWQPVASRVDLALNIRGGKLTPRKCYEAVKRGALKAKTRSYRFVEGKNGDISGDTLYLGSPQSDRMCRIYDKKAERRLAGVDEWLRIELQTRSDRAKNAFASTRDNGSSSAVAGHLEDFITWDNPEYTEALGWDAVEPDELPVPDRNRRRWLLTQCAPALAKEASMSPEFYNQFLEEVARRLDLLK